MTDTLGRYAIGLALGIALGAIGTWRMAHDSADRILSDWERAVEAQRVAERARTDAITRKVQDGHAIAVADLRRRLLAGWRPTIPAAAGVSADRIPAAAAGTDAGAGDAVPGAGRSAAEVELATCTAERARLIGDGAEATLQLLHLQAWVSLTASPENHR